MVIKQIGENKFRVTISKRDPLSKKPKSVMKMASSRKEAEKAEKALLKKLQQILSPKSINWQKACLKTWVYEEGESLNKNTLFTYQTTLAKYTHQWDKLSIKSITAQDIKHLFREVMKDRSDYVKQTVYKALKKVFNYSIDSGFIKYSPVPQIHFKFNSKIKKVLTLEQAKQLLNLAKNHNHEYYPIWCLALYTGMRSGELFALKWEQVSFKQEQILVNVSWNSKSGFKSTKSGDDRIVPISPKALSLLKSLKIKSKANDFVLPRLRSWEKGKASEVLRMFLIGNRIPPVRFHDLRATWATLLLSKNIAPSKVMAVGGWKNIKTMMIYMRKAGIDIKGVNDVLDFGEVEPNSKTNQKPISLF